MFIVQNPAKICLVTNRTHGTTNSGRKYTWIWQGLFKGLREPWGACDRLLCDSTKISALQLLDTCFDKMREAESHSNPISAFQGQGKTAEMQLASVALRLWETAVVIRIKVNRDLSKIKLVSFLPGSNERLGSLRIQEKEKESTKLLKILTSVWLLLSQLICGWVQKWGKERMRSTFCC